MRSGIKWRGNHHTIIIPRCPCCGFYCKVAFKGDTIVGIKHTTFKQDAECPYVKQQDANPMNRYQKVVFNYADLEDRMLSAREALRKTENKERRLDGRPSRATDNVIEGEAL